MRHPNDIPPLQTSIMPIEHEIEEVDCTDILKDLYRQEREDDDDLLLDGEKELDFN